MVQWVGLCLPMQGVQVQPLDGKLRSPMPWPEKKKKKLNRNNVINSIKTVEISLKRNLYRDAEKAKYQ